MSSHCALIHQIRPALACTCAQCTGIYENIFLIFELHDEATKELRSETINPNFGSRCQRGMERQRLWQTERTIKLINSDRDVPSLARCHYVTTDGDKRERWSHFWARPPPSPSVHAAWSINCIKIRRSPAVAAGMPLSACGIGMGHRAGQSRITDPWFKPKFQPNLNIFEGINSLHSL